MKKLPVLFGILLLSAVMMSLTDKPVEGLQVGDIAPQIDLKGVDGKISVLNLQKRSKAGSLLSLATLVPTLFYMKTGSLLCIMKWHQKDGL